MSARVCVATVAPFIFFVPSVCYSADEGSGAAAPSYSTLVASTTRPTNPGVYDWKAHISDDDESPDEKDEDEDEDDEGVDGASTLDAYTIYSTLVASTTHSRPTRACMSGRHTLVMMTSLRTRRRRRRRTMGRRTKRKRMTAGMHVRKAARVFENAARRRETSTRHRRRENATVRTHKTASVCARLRGCA